MANTLTTKKNIRVTARRTAVNKSRKSRIRTFLKKVEESISNSDESQIRKSFVEYESELMKGVSKGVYKKNTASRKLRNLANNIKKLKETK